MDMPKGKNDSEIARGEKQMGKYNFDEIIERRGTGSSKWDAFARRFPGYNVEDALPMWVADMDFRVPKEITDAVKAKAAEEIYGYPAPPGPDFYNAITEWIRKHLGWKISPRWIVPATGVVQAITHAVQEFTEEGDGILIQPPVYYPFRNQCIEYNNRCAVTSPLIERNGHWEIDYADFEEKAAREDVKLFILCSPHNPVGRVWTREELVRIFRICQRYDVLVVSDEIHSDLIMPGYQHTASGLITSHNLIACYAPSKTFNLAGLKTSAIVIPDTEIRSRYKSRIRKNQAGSLNFFGAPALIAAYTKGDAWVREVTAYIDGNIRHARQRIQEELYGITSFRTEGTYFLWMNFRGTGLKNSIINKKILEEAKVAGDLGEWFGDEGKGFLRLNLACPRKTVDEALDRLQRVFGKN